MNREIAIKDIYKDLSVGNERFPTRALGLDSELSYGETPPNTVESMLGYKRRRDRIFYDLGSADGRVVMQMAMYSGLHRRFDLTVGIEVVPQRHRVALQALERAQSSGFLKAQVDFRQGSFLSTNFSDGDLIYVNSTTLREETLYDLTSQFQMLKPNSRVFLVDRDIHLPDFDKLAKLKLSVNGMRADVNIFEKKY